MSDVLPNDEEKSPLAGQLVGNLGEPLSLTDINIAGISAGSARSGEPVQIFTRLELTSDEELFHKIILNLVPVIDQSVQAAGVYTPLDRAGTILLIIHPDHTGQLWVDTAAMCTYTAVKRPGATLPGTPLFESDIADIRGMWFPLVKIDPKDRVICIIREGWRFGLFCDFNPDGKLSIDAAKRDLGKLFRRMRYADRYAVVAHEPTFSGLVSAGWFPFLELLSGEFQMLSNTQKAGFPLEDAERQVLEKFDDARIDRMFERWMENPQFKAKEKILKSAIRTFKIQESVAVIKTIITEIEGIMAETYFEVTGNRSRKPDILLDFMIDLAAQRAGGKDTLFFPVEFGRYLKEYTYANFDGRTTGNTGSAGSRHAVGHGAAASEGYTMTRALQALLTLDQLGFYM